MAFAISPVLGANFNDVYTAAQATSFPAGIPHRLGTQSWGDDGKLYVFARANATIAANTAVSAVSASTFLATATGGAYTSPATGLASGDYAWFGKASV